MNFGGRLWMESDRNNTLDDYWDQDGIEWSEENLTDVQEEIVRTYMNHMQLLLEKNRRYGNSAVDHDNVFSKAGGIESICIRMDDKLKRIKHNKGGLRKNDISDLIGYGMLLMVAKGWHSFEEMID